MQIHELNNFTGTLGSGAYLAIDDGTDTGKISSQGLLAATEARIDNIIAGPAPSAQEVTDARLGADGVTYSSLGNAIRSQVTDLKSDFSDIETALNPIVSINHAIEFVDNYYINTNKSEGETVDVSSPSPDSSSKYAVVPCREGDKFYIKAKSYTSASAWAFVTESNALINKSGTGSIETIITAPTSAKKVIFNGDKSATPTVAYKTAGVNGFADLSEKLSGLINGIETITFGLVKDSYPNKNTGEIIDEPGGNWDRTDYIPVNGGESIWTNCIYASNYNCFYDANKDFISGFQISIGSPSYISVPDNARYMIASNSAVANRMFTAFYRVAPFIDNTLTQANKASDAKVVGDNIDRIDSSLENISENVSDLMMNLILTETDEPSSISKQLGCVAPDGSISSSTTYFYTSQIDVQEGDIIYPYVGNPTQTKPIRFVCAYENGTPNASKGSSAETTDGYTVPNGVTKVVLTCYASDMANMSFAIDRLSTITDVKHNKNAWGLVEKADSVGANSELVIANSSALYNKKNCAYSFFGQFNAFTGIEIGHGKNILGSSYIKIDGTYLYAYQSNGSTDVEVGKYAHSLTFADFIDVNINVGDIALPTAKVTIYTNGGQFVCDDVPFIGCRGEIYALPYSAMTDVVLSYSMRDLKHDVYIFGDSYISLNDINRWPYHIIDKGYKSYMLCGFPGAGSRDMLTALNAVLSIARPKYIVWAVGMNNADADNMYNVVWKTALDRVMQMCEEMSCELILATIPNTPLVSNYYKNEYVRNSGYRYIDFAKAVNAESAGATWYSGMLSNDNIHPTQAGARALAYKVLADFPEIM